MHRKVNVVEDLDGKKIVFIHDIVLREDKQLNGMK